MKSGLLALSAIVTMTTAAMGDCRTIGSRFSFAQNTATTTTGVSTKGAPCGMRFTSPVDGRLDSIAVAARPSHGALREFGGMSWLYKPAGGFKGTDSYTLRLCGRSTAGAGCATVTYNITVE
jgi:hypothetical protein